MTIIVGIDPGIKGALAWLNTDTGKITQVRDMPLNKVTLSSGRKRNRVDSELLNTYLADNPADLIIIEDQNGWNMGAQSAFNLGHGLGTLEAIGRVNCAAVLTVAPSKWKPRLGVPADKGKAMAFASDLWGPELWPLKKHDGRAEASLIAEYGRRLLQGEITVPADPVEDIGLDSGADRIADSGAELSEDSGADSQEAIGGTV